jgi:hypothetical protein
MFYDISNYFYVFPKLILRTVPINFPKGYPFGNHKAVIRTCNRFCFRIIPRGRSLALLGGLRWNVALPVFKTYVAGETAASCYISGRKTVGKVK